MAPVFRSTPSGWMVSKIERFCKRDTSLAASEDIKDWIGAQRRMGKEHESVRDDDKWQRRMNIDSMSSHKQTTHPSILLSKASQKVSLSILFRNGQNRKAREKEQLKRCIFGHNALQIDGICIRRLLCLQGTESVSMKAMLWRKVREASFREDSDDVEKRPSRCFSKRRFM